MALRLLKGVLGLGNCTFSDAISSLESYKNHFGSSGYAIWILARGIGGAMTTTAPLVPLDFSF